MMTGCGEIIGLAVKILQPLMCVFTDAIQAFLHAHID